jgi:hypothetical protein
MASIYLWKDNRSIIGRRYRELVVNRSSSHFIQLDPPRALYILDLPIRAMRVITDPIVDFVTVILGLFVFPSLYWSIRLVLNILLFLTRQKASSDDIIEWTVIALYSSMKEFSHSFADIEDHNYLGQCCRILADTLTFSYRLVITAP